MDTNFIRNDGFSNPDTERLFRETCGEKKMHARCRARKHCGICRSAWFLVDSPDENLWLVCTAEESPYFLETVHFAFTCAHQMPGSEVKAIQCPWQAIPPEVWGPSVFGLGIDEEEK